MNQEEADQDVVDEVSEEVDSRGMELQFVLKILIVVFVCRCLQLT